MRVAGVLILVFVAGSHCFPFFHHHYAIPEALLANFRPMMSPWNPLVQSLFTPRIPTHPMARHFIINLTPEDLSNASNQIIKLGRIPMITNIQLTDSPFKETTNSTEPTTKPSDEEKKTAEVVPSTPEEEKKPEEITTKDIVETLILEPSAAGQENVLEPSPAIINDEAKITTIEAPELPLDVSDNRTEESSDKEGPRQITEESPAIQMSDAADSTQTSQSSLTPGTPLEVPSSTKEVDDIKPLFDEIDALKATLNIAERELKDVVKTGAEKEESQLEKPETMTTPTLEEVKNVEGEATAAPVAKEQKLEKLLEKVDPRENMILDIVE